MYSVKVSTICFFRRKANCNLKLYQQTVQPMTYRRSLLLRSSVKLMKEPCFDNCVPIKLDILNIH